MAERVKEAEEARKAGQASGTSNASTAALPTTDYSSILNHIVLLGAVGVLGYLAHTVLKHSEDF